MRILVVISFLNLFYGNYYIVWKVDSEQLMCRSSSSVNQKLEDLSVGNNFP